MYSFSLFRVEPFVEGASCDTGIVPLVTSGVKSTVYHCAHSGILKIAKTVAGVRYVTLLS